MKVENLDIEGLKIIQLKIWADQRGFLTERFNVNEFRKLGLPLEFAQDNHSRSLPGVLRGLHYQCNPSQEKLVGVIRGKIWDIAVDIRPESKTFGKSFSIELSDDNGLLFWIPSGFAHGFVVLGNEPADVLYKVTSPYNPQGEGGIRWNDPDLGIQWPIAHPILSDRDRGLPTFQQFKKLSPN